MASSLLHASQLPPAFRELFIHTGYRPRYSKLRTCLASVFYENNETLNVWTHVLAALYFAWSFTLDDLAVRCRTLWSGNPEGPCHQIVYAFVVSVIVVFVVSAAAHVFNCMSSTWRDLCFMFDYTAIAIYGSTTSAMYFCLLRPYAAVFHESLTSEVVFLTLVVISGLTAMLVSCWTRLHRKTSSQSHVYVIRTCAFAIPVFVGSVPAFGRCFVELSGFLRQGNVPSVLKSVFSPLEQTVNQSGVFFNSNDVKGRDSSTSLEFTVPFLYHTAYISLAAIVNMSKLPERVWPGKFDVYGHSHQWFHILIFMGIREQFWLIMNEISRDDAHAHTTFQDGAGRHPVSSASSMWLAISALSLGVVLILIWFGWSVVALDRSESGKGPKTLKQPTKRKIKKLGKNGVSNGKVD